MDGVSAEPTIGQRLRCVDLNITADTERGTTILVGFVAAAKQATDRIAIGTR